MRFPLTFVLASLRLSAEAARQLGFSLSAPRRLSVVCLLRGPGRSLHAAPPPSVACRRSGSRRPCLLRRPSSHVANSIHPRRGCSRIRLPSRRRPSSWRGPCAVSFLISRIHVRSSRAAPFWIALLGDLRDCLPRWYFTSFCSCLDPCLALIRLARAGNSCVLWSLLGGCYSRCGLAWLDRSAFSLLQNPIL